VLSLSVSIKQLIVRNVIARTKNILCNLVACWD
jgi:hypothetical protein